MKKIYAVIMSLFICCGLAACSEKQIEYISSDLFSGARSEISLKNTDSIAVYVQPTQDLYGVELETVGSGELTVTVYSYERDYAKTVADGAVKVKKKLVCTQQNSVQTIFFDALAPGEYLIVFSCESDLDIAGYESAVGCSFFRNGTAQENGAAGIRLLFGA